MQNKMEVANALFDSIDIIIDKKLEKLGFDRTIVAEVIADKTADGYQVKYQDSKFNARPIGNTEYSIGDYVYVVILSNNMKRAKFIYGKVQKGEAPIAAPYNQLSLQREINALKIQQEILISALRLSLEGDNEGALNKLNEIEGGDING